MSLREELAKLEIPRCSACRHQDTQICADWTNQDPEQNTLLCPGGLDQVVGVFKNDLQNKAGILIASGYLGNVNIGNYLNNIAAGYELLNVA